MRRATAGREAIDGEGPTEQQANWDWIEAKYVKASRKSPQLHTCRFPISRDITFFDFLEEENCVKFGGHA